MSTIALMLVFFTLFPSLTSAATIDFFISTNESPELKLNPYVSDPRGIKAGYLEDGSPTTTKLGEGFGIDRIDDDVDGSLGNAVMVIHVNPVRIGTYTVIFYGLSDTNYTLDTKYQLRTGVRPLKTEYAGFISSGAVRTYSMVVSDSNQPPVLLKDATFGTLRQDLAVAARTHQLPPGDTGKLQIGDAEFVAKLDKILAEGEKALSKTSGNDKDRENKKEAVEKLREFVKKLEKAFKGEKDDEHDDEDDDKDHKNKEHEKPKKRFVNELAFKSLRGDTETLIAALGGKPGKEGKDD